MEEVRWCGVEHCMIRMIWGGRGGGGGGRLADRVLIAALCGKVGVAVKI